jgi:hypothetical protein
VREINGFFLSFALARRTYIQLESVSNNTNNARNDTPFLQKKDSVPAQKHPRTICYICADWPVIDLLPADAETSPKNIIEIILGVAANLDRNLTKRNNGPYDFDVPL